MARRKELKGIVHGLASSFVSRNNDIHGYWGIGKLYKHAIDNKTNVVEIDLMSQTITPPSSNFNMTIAEISTSLFKKLKKLGLPKACLTQFYITVEFAQTDDASKPLAHLMGAPFTCTVTSTDDLGQIRTTSLQGRCHPHSPFREKRRNNWLKG